ncbi:substrate-binding domain-containing protein [Actinomadura welshii]
MNVWRRPAAWAAAALALSVVGGGAWAAGLLPGTTSCGGDRLRITIAAQPEIAPPLGDVAERFNVEEHRVAGRCVHARIEPVSPTGYLSDMTVRATADAWVPESSLWLNVAREAGESAVPEFAAPVAATPVVFATSRPVEAEFRDADVEISWRLLLDDEAGGLPLARTVAAPRTGMSGTIAMIAVDQVADDDAGDVAEALRENAPGGPGGQQGASTAVLAGLIDAERYARPLAVTTEQAVIAHNAAHRPNPLVGLMPAEGTLLLDHPYAVTAEDWNRRNAAEAFRAALATGTARGILHEAGFRAPDGTLASAYADEHGLPEEPPPSLRLPTPEEIEDALTSWEG